MSAKRPLESVVDVLAGMAGRILASSSERRAERLIGRFPTHRLQDIGFERDWDGSAYRPSDYR
jgi:hypothetical protein